MSQYPTRCRLSDPLQYQSIVDAEWNIIYDKLDKCVQSGAKIVLSRLAIGDLATQVSSSFSVFFPVIMLYIFVA
jgi:T-complex protein 1 subunit eta